jgi:hypothetical protein
MNYKTRLNNYRYDQYGSLYQFDEIVDGYIFIGRLNGKSIESFIEDYEEEINPQFDYGY